MQNINEALKGNIETISKEVSTSKEELDNKEVLIQKYKVRKEDSLNFRYLLTSVTFAASVLILSCFEHIPAGIS